jgi:hypothetical protein
MCNNLIIKRVVINLIEKHHANLSRGMFFLSTYCNVGIYKNTEFKTEECGNKLTILMLQLGGGWGEVAIQKIR